MTRTLDELGCYLLGGQPRSAREVLDEVADAERLGLGTAFLSERYNKKEIGAFAGAAAAASTSVRLCTAATNHNTRHPMVTAGMTRTLRDLTDGRFTLGIGRGVAVLQGAYGIPPITTAQMADFALLMRRLFRGETIVGHDGPSGRYPVLYLDSELDEYLPLGIVAFGPETLKLGGRLFDDVVLHTYFTDETTSRCVDLVKSAAEEAGRDPDSVKVWACLATVGDHIAPVDVLRKTVGRLGTYLQGYGQLLVDTNGWDPVVLQRFLSDPVISSVGGLDIVGTTDQLEHAAGLLPDEWLAPAATGTPAQCVDAIRHQFDLGCDGVILHGSTPAELAPIVAAYRGAC
ncbi:TIGR03857 family LLM class F420-dependent oxidoreductase [Rhodococcus sp. NPDC004095]